jgi:LysM repeat protein
VAQYPSFKPYEPSQIPREQTRETKSWNKTLLAIGILVILVGLVLTPVMAVLGFYGYFQVTDLIVPGVYVGDTQVGSARVYDAAIRLHRDWNMGQQFRVEMPLPEEVRTRTVSPAEVGLSLDAPKTAQNAHLIGRGPGMRNRLSEMYTSLVDGTQVDPVITFNQEAGESGLAALANLLGIPAQDATLYISDGKPEVIPGIPGIAIDIEKTLAEVSADPYKVFMTGSLTLSTKSVSPRIQDVSAALAEAERLVNATVELYAYDPVTDEHLSWSIPAEEVRTWVVVDQGEDGPQVSLSERSISDFLGRFNASIGPEQWIDPEIHTPILFDGVQENNPVKVIIQYQPTTYTIQPGDSLLAISWRIGIPMWKVMQANPGLDPDMLFAGQDLVIPPKDAMLSLPVIENKRIVVSLDEQHMWLYQDGELLDHYKISTGLDRSPTQPGIFQVQTHVEEAYASIWDLYMPHFIGIYEAWPGFMNGFHGLPTLSTGRRLWVGVLGRPVSFGCIVLDLKPAEDLFQWAEKGVVVEILP